MIDLLVGILSAFAKVIGHLGIKGTIGAAIGLVLLYFLVRFLDRADRLFERFQRRYWRRWSKGTRHAVLFLVGTLVVVNFGGALWGAFPKTPGGLAFLLGGYTAYAYQACRFVERYNLTDTTFWQAWCHHFEVSRSARRHTGAINDATTKKGGRARKPTPHATGESFVAEPPHGMSAEELATEYNEGRMTSAEAHRLGWGEVRGVNATPMPDGTVLVNVDRVDPDGGEPLAESRWWTP